MTPDPIHVQSAAAPEWLQPADPDEHPQPSGCVRYLGLAVFVVIAVVQAWAHWNGGLL